MKFPLVAFLVVCLSAHSAPCFAWTSQRLVALAREAVRCEVLHLPTPQMNDKELPMPVFVTIERKGKVIGCRGTLRSTQSSLEAEVVRAARSAAAFDPRYRPLRPDDLKDFAVTVSVVERQVPLSLAELPTLAPEEGLVLQSGERFGIVLPYEGRAPQTRLQWAWKKAGVAPGSSHRLFRLIAQRFRG